MRRAHGATSMAQVPRIEDAGRVGDPTSLVRPCKTIEDGRSLVLTVSNGMCIEDELLRQASHVSL